MCIQCEIEDSIIDLHAKDYIVARLDGESLSTGQMESLLGTPDFGRVLIDLTERGRVAADLGTI